MATTKTRMRYNSEKVRNESYGLSVDGAKTMCERIYAALRKYGDMTAEEIGSKINKPVHVIHARLNELMEDELVIDTEKTKINEETNRPNTLWHALPIKLTLF